MSDRAPFARGPAETVGSLGRWAVATVLDPWRLAAHQLWWLASRRLEDDELDLPDLDRPLPGDPDTLQRAGDGVGDLHVRRYRLVVATDRPVAAAVELLRDHLDELVPARFVRFRTASGSRPSGLEVGDEFVARLTGPRDGPVRVVERREDGYRLATLRGHVEAGEIDFRVGAPREGRLLVEVRSWARSGSDDVRLLYERGGGRRVQAHVWASLCLALAERLDGRAVGRVEVATRRLPWSPDGQPTGTSSDAA
jgi:hypothetical protein